MLNHAIAVYGYWAVAMVVGLESTGIPLPGETALVTAAIYAATTHQLNIMFVVIAAAAGGIAGDNLGFWIGQRYGYTFLAAAKLCARGGSPRRRRILRRREVTCARPPRRWSRRGAGARRSG